MTSWLRVVAICVLLLSTHIMAHFNDPRLRAFNINVEDEGERHVTLNDNGEEASCSFSFKTSTTTIDPVCHSSLLPSLPFTLPYAWFLTIYCVL
jgi:hypothetical protein